MKPINIQYLYQIWYVIYLLAVAQLEALHKRGKQKTKCRTQSV